MLTYFVALKKTYLWWLLLWGEGAYQCMQVPKAIVCLRNFHLDSTEILGCDTMGWAVGPTASYGLDFNAGPAKKAIRTI